MDKRKHNYENQGDSKRFCNEGQVKNGIGLNTVCVCTFRNSLAIKNKSGSSVLFVSLLPELNWNLKQNF